MKILLFGKNGQVGTELQRSLAPLGELVALGSTGHELCGDFNNPDGIERTIHAIKPNIIVNATAYTAVDKAERDRENARRVNSLTPGVIAHTAKKYGAILVHYSTDYVFDGSGIIPWTETDPTAPINMYGQTKREGELAIQEAECSNLIFRSSWIYALHGNNFMKTVFRLAREQNELKIINDQVGVPTGADLVADVTAHALRHAISNPQVSGIYHLAAKGETTWYQYAQFIVACARQMGGDIKVDQASIIPISSEDFPTLARRPHNSRLNTTKLAQTFNFSLPHWQAGVERVLYQVLKDQTSWTH